MVFSQSPCHSPSRPSAPDPLRTKPIIAGTVLPLVLALDWLTKRWALEALYGESRSLLGGWIPLNLAFNRGAAFGISLGPDPRWIFIPLTLVALVVLGRLFLQTPSSDPFRLTSVALVFSGALGNLIDRVRWERGVVDFIGPIDLGFMEWPIFNVADMAITCGAVALAVSFWTEDRRKPGGGGEGVGPDETVESS